VPRKTNFAGNEGQRREMARRLKRAREDAGLTLQAAAAAVNHVHGWLTQIEAGKRGIDALDLERLADLYGYPVDFFVKLDFDPRNRFRPKTRADFQAVYGDQPGLPELMHSAYESYHKARLATLEPT